MEVLELSRYPVGDFWKNKRVFVTGHTGFKGSWLCHWLIMLGAKVRGYSVSEEKNRSFFGNSNLTSLLEHEIADIRETERLKLALRSFDPEIIIHLAAQPIVRLSYEIPEETWSVNLMGGLSLLSACKSIEPDLKHPLAIVFVTTDKVYENLGDDVAFSENDRLGGDDPYSSSKAASELLVSSWNKSFWSSKTFIKIATARSGNVIGGGDWSCDRLFPDYVRAATNGKKLELRNPLSTRPWQHVLDPLNGYLCLAESLFNGAVESGSAWNFGPDLHNNLSVIEMVNLCQGIWPLDILFKQNKSQCQKPEASKLQLSSNNAKNILSWVPIWGPKEAVFETLTWYKSYYSGFAAGKLCEEQIIRYQKVDSKNRQ